MRARRYRFRILNGSVSRYFAIALVKQIQGAAGEIPGPAGSGVSYNRVPLHMIANDGNIMEHAVPFDGTLDLDGDGDLLDHKGQLPSQAIAERYDIIVDFSKHGILPGDRLYFVNVLEHDNGRRPDRRILLEDHLPTSKGAEGVSGNRNAPTVLNAGFQAVQFWDGRAHDLEEQAKGPLLNPIEMAMRTEEDVVHRLRSAEDYGRGFALAFPNQAEPVTFDNVARAIAAFERTLVTPSRFDRYLKGETEALTRDEQFGLQRFVDTGCIDCHGSHLVGGRLLRKLGVYHLYENKSDTGRFGITGREEDRFVFKVCMLRNVTLTPPYFHDGQVSTLPEAVRLMAWMQLDTVLSPDEIDEILRFLRTLEAEHPVTEAPPP